MSPAEPDVFAAVGDATRRRIVERLSDTGVGTATQLATELGISRQGVAKHLNILADAGLVTATKVGREARYQPVPEALAELTDWVSVVTDQWTHRLKLLAESLE